MKGLASFVRVFITTKLSIILIVLAVAVGIYAILTTPREEEPQIVVPMADIIVEFPGHSAAEVEEFITRRLDNLLYQIDGVEHVYSVARRGQALVTVRFFVGEDRERSFVKLNQRIEANKDIVPDGVTQWIVKPVEIDDVPIVTVALTSGSRDSYELRRIAEEVMARLESVNDVSRTEIIGGYPREFLIEIDVDKLAAKRLTLLDVAGALRRRNIEVNVGKMPVLDVILGDTFNNYTEVGDTIIAVQNGMPVYLRDVVERIVDGPQEPNFYTSFMYGAAANVGDNLKGKAQPCVTLAFSKKKGTNAVVVAEDIVDSIDTLKGVVIPADVDLVVTRNYGDTANEKVNDLMSSLFFAILTVVLLLIVTLGWREALIVAVAVPISFALALFVNDILGFTINRVTLFALILSLGLVVDDPITNVDNIQRHMRQGKGNPLDCALKAVSEVLPPVIMSTLVIIASFIPMFFITGMMGPYMRPMASNVPLTVTFSTVCALTIVPWMSYKLLKRYHGKGNDKKVVDRVSLVGRSYGWLVSRLLASVVWRYSFFGLIILLLVFSGLLVIYRAVPLKMLPFDNKNELQIVVDLPEGTSLEDTQRVVSAIQQEIVNVPEVIDVQTYSGTASPMDFNGLVRHYYFRGDSNHGELRIKLLDKDSRSEQSHAIALRIRDMVEHTAEKYGAIAKIVEVPPGPPVLSTIVAEVYGEPILAYDEILTGAKQLQKYLLEEDAVVEIDDMSEAEHNIIRFVPDVDKGAVNGIDVATITDNVQVALSGMSVGNVHIKGERNPLTMVLRLPRSQRYSLEVLKRLWLRPAGMCNMSLVPLEAITASFREEVDDQPIYRKDGKRVVFVTAEVAGRAPAEAILDVQEKIEEDPLSKGVYVDWAGEGEWQVTLRVFRDLGIAFGVAMLAIYLLLVIETSSFAMPILIMTAIPLTAIGIVPGFWLLNLFFTKPVGGYDNPVFFTATAMIGMIALGGIVVRNSIVLITFIRDSRAQGMPLNEAVVQAGIVRFRPIILTALTTALGAWPITLDPIFSGLAWALIFGLAASTVFTLFVVPTIYAMIMSKRA